jgi:hypothetical protein
MGIDELLAKHPAPWKYCPRGCDHNAHVFRDANGEIVLDEFSDSCVAMPFCTSMHDDKIASMLNAYASMKAENADLRAKLDGLAEVVKAADELRVCFTSSDDNRRCDAMSNFDEARAKVKP